MASDCIWQEIRNDAEAMNSEGGPVDKDLDMVLDAVDTEEIRAILNGSLQNSILRWRSLDESLSAHLASKLSSDSVPFERWRSLLLSCFTKGSSWSGESVHDIVRKDLMAIKERDPACPSLGHAFLYFKGFHGIQAYRASNWLWRNGYKSMASLLQSRISEVFGMDIHPAAQLGSSIMIDHATGVVIGETARVSNGCTLLHAVTLGGNGKQQGDRHPKLGINVLVGAGASILGNVNIGDGAKIGASAVVLNDIPPFATAVGCPAKIIGRAKEDNAASLLDHSCKFVEIFSQRLKCLCPYRHLKPSKPGHLGPYEFVERLSKNYGVKVPKDKAMAWFFELDTDHDGELLEAEFERVSSMKEVTCTAA